MQSLEDEEKTYLRNKLDDVQIPLRDAFLPIHYPHLSPKVQTLMNFLKEENSANFSGLIFVRTRVEVAVLSHLLAVLTTSFEVSTFVGASNFSGRKAAISELADVKNQTTTLEDLRHGRKNLVVTTNALEEGIDVSRCRLVICFDKPTNLKSFIQRRGRARKSDSRYVIMFENGLRSEAIADWTALEAQMREIYMDDLRRLKEIEDEEGSDETAASRREPLFVKSTGYTIYNHSGRKLDC